MKCFCHSKDLDGFCSGAIVKRAFPECELYGVDYSAIAKKYGGGGHPQAAGFQIDEIPFKV